MRSLDAMLDALPAARPPRRRLTRTVPALGFPLEPLDGRIDGAKSGYRGGKIHFHTGEFAAWASSPPGGFAVEEPRHVSPVPRTAPSSS
jgi:hypothetical protein